MICELILKNRDVVKVPTAPGSGVEIDPDFMAKFLSILAH